MILNRFFLQAFGLTAFATALLFTHVSVSAEQLVFVAANDALATESKTPRSTAAAVRSSQRVPTSQVELNLSDPLNNSSFFGGAVSLDGNLALVGDRFYGDLSHGRAFLFSFDGSAWTQSQIVFPQSGVRSNYNFGTSVSLSGDFALIGMKGDVGSGGVFAFKSDGTVYSQQAFLRPSDLAARSNFGSSISLEGNRALIGAPNDAENGDSSGSAYIYEFNGVNWDQKAKLLASDGVANERFGTSVTIQGDRGVVSAVSGVYVFDLVNGNWQETTKLVPTNGDSSIATPDAVDMSSDYIFVGATKDDDQGSNAGAVYVFRNEGDAWSQNAKLTASDGAAFDRFGGSISADADRLAIGASEDDGNFPDTGSTYIFGAIEGEWREESKLTAIGGSTQDLFGRAVSLSGNRALVGAPSSFSNSSAYVFTLNSWPIANADEFSTDEDSGISGNLFLDNGSGVDSDPDAEPIWVNEVDGNPQLVGIETELPSGALILIDSSGAFSYDPNGSFERLGVLEQGSDSFIYTITDGSATASAVVSLTIQGVGDPTIAFDDQFTILEDAGVTDIDVLANDSGDSPVTIIEISQPSNGNASISQDGETLRYAPDLDYCSAAGSPDNLQYTLIGGSTAQVEIAVGCVNDAPEFQQLGDVEVIEDAGYDAAWAFDISPGPANESEQSISFLTLFISNPGLFLQEPEIDATGRLTFTPKPDTTGYAEIEVVAVDSGGAENGGTPSSVVQTFRIEVISAVDLSISKVSDSFFTSPGGNIQYRIEVANTGPSDAVGARVVDDPPVRLGNITWTCIPQSGSTCNSSGVGVINEFVIIPEGSGVTFTLDAAVLDFLNEPITNHAYVDAPVGVLELSENDNTDSDTDLIALFADGMESEEP